MRIYILSLFNIIIYIERGMRYYYCENADGDGWMCCLVIGW